MNRSHVPSIRKHLLDEAATAQPRSEHEIDISGCATIAFTSEDPRHPIENLFDGGDAAGDTYWAGVRSGAIETVVLEFDEPQRISRLLLAAEERDVERTQEVRIEASCDAASTYRPLLVQQYTFSPGGATFQREDYRLSIDPVTHLRLTIAPGNTGLPKLTSLRLFA